MKDAGKSAQMPGPLPSAMVAAPAAFKRHLKSGARCRRILSAYTSVTSGRCSSTPPARGPTPP